MTVLLGAGLVGNLFGAGQSAPPADEDVPHFRTGVELINVTTTVTDRHGRFVSGLTRDAFRVYEDDEPVDVTFFANERVPVSLGIVLDTSGSMVGERIAAARQALGRFLDRLDQDDEIFLVRFDDEPALLTDWTSDRDRLNRALTRVRPVGDTALYDAVAESVTFAQTGRHLKKALVVVSDGNDTSSRTSRSDVKQLIRQSEVLVYAIGVDGPGSMPVTTTPRLPFPVPWPGPRLPGPGGTARVTSDRLNTGALRDLTDDSGGRTETIRSPRDLEPATAGIADELSRQYVLGYPGPGHKDGRWHAIRVDVSDRHYRVRHRRGYLATP